MNFFQGISAKEKIFVGMTLIVLLGIGLYFGFYKKDVPDVPMLRGFIPPQSEIYVANMGDHSIMGFERNLDGSLADTPVRIIRGPATGLHNPFDVAVDGLNRIWVANLGNPPANNPSITVYEPNTNGNDSASFTFPLFSASGLFLPGSLSRLDGNRFLVTGINANNATSLSSGTALGFNVNLIREENGSIFFGNEINDRGQLINPTGIVFNTNKAFVATSSLPLIYGLYQIPGLSTSAILIYDLQRNGTFSVNPASMIAGNSTSLSNPAHIEIDRTGNLFVLNRGTPGSGSDLPSITVFAAGQTGNVAPIQKIQGQNTGLVIPGDSYGIAVDENGFIYVSTGNRILVFGPGANGNTSPVHIRSNTAISTSKNVDLSSPIGLATR